MHSDLHSQTDNSEPEIDDSSEDEFIKYALTVPSRAEAFSVLHRTKHIKNIKAFMKNVLYEEKEIEKELKKNAAQIKYRTRRVNEEYCNCGVKNHPEKWNDFMIVKIHDNSWMTDCSNLQLPQSLVIHTKNNGKLKFMIVPENSNSPWRIKAQQVIRFADIETGFKEELNLHLGFQQPADRQIYLTVKRHKVIACLVAETVHMAFRLIERCEDSTLTEENSVSVKCGVNRIWVHVGFRRKKIATELMKTLQYFFNKNEILRLDDIAFSDLTEDGLHFAKSFLHTHNIPIYTSSCK